MTAVTEHLKRRGIPFEVKRHPRAFTSIDEARALGVPASAIAKTVVLDVGSGHALAVIPGSRRLDMKRVRAAVGDEAVHLATEEEIERDFPGFEPGALPPLGSLLVAPTFVDPELAEHDEIWFADGAQDESVLVRTEELFQSERPTMTPLAREVGPGDEDRPL